MKNLIPLFIALLVLSCSGDKKSEAAASESSASQEQTDASSKEYPTQVYFGDTHLHTALSMDAGAFGNRLGMDEAYQFARGDEITSTTGVKTKLQQPLDFLVVADHSDGMGFFPDLMAGKEHVMKYEESKKWKKMIDEGKGGEAAVDIIKTFFSGQFPV